MTRANLLPVTLNSVEKRLTVMSVLYLLCIHSVFGAQLTFLNFSPFVFSTENTGRQSHFNCNKESSGILCKFIHFEMTVSEGTFMNLRHYFNKETEQKNLELCLCFKALRHLIPDIKDTQYLVQ